MRVFSRRMAARALFVAAIGRSTFPPLPAGALKVAERSEEERLAISLYGNGEPDVQSFSTQVSDAISIKTMRGVWSFKETYSSGATTTGQLIFRGADASDRGTVTYESEGAKSGRGPWIIKSDGFGRNPRGQGGIIEQKGLWKLRRGSAGTFAYAGRINVGASPLDAVVKGDIVQLIDGGKPKGGSEKKVGKFEASLQRKLNAGEETAATDSAESGGAVQALQVTSVMDSRLVYK